MQQKKSYSEKLSHPLWQKKRLEILNRDNFKCTLCENEELQLHIHHLKYEFNKNPWDYPNSNLITVCKICHQICEFSKNGFTHPEKVHYIQNYNNTEQYTYSVLTNLLSNGLKIKVILLFRCIESDIFIIATIKVSSFVSIYKKFNL